LRQSAKPKSGWLKGTPFSPTLTGPERRAIDYTSCGVFTGHALDVGDDFGVGFVSGSLERYSEEVVISSPMCWRAPKSSPQCHSEPCTPGQGHKADSV